jgi:putative PIN family toxin of toxin-antitoxin system
MRVVLDTNVFVSAALKDQSLPALAVHLVEERCILLKSIATERQLFNVLARPHFALLIAPATHAWLRKLLTEAERVTITERIAACRDPTDDKFLELAINGHADVIVSGDTDLLALDPFRGIPIMPPATFVQRARG